MTTFTELVATAVVHSSALALSHFGVTMEPSHLDKVPPASERVIARTHASIAPPQALKLTSCPHPAKLVRPIRA